MSEMEEVCRFFIKHRDPTLSSRQITELSRIFEPLMKAVMDDDPTGWSKLHDLGVDIRYFKPEEYPSIAEGIVAVKQLLRAYCQQHLSEEFALKVTNFYGLDVGILDQSDAPRLQPPDRQMTLTSNRQINLTLGDDRKLDL